MCEFHDSNWNGFADMWWTDKCTYFCSIDSGISFLVLAHILTPSIVLARSFLSRLVGILVLTPILLLLLLPFNSYMGIPSDPGDFPLVSAF